MEFTLSVRSFQVPATPGTCAWPPSLPSVPTSRATRVTSPANALSWSTIVLMVFFSSRISPFTSTVILRDRSPRATAVVTSAMLRTWPVRLDAMEFTFSVRSFQVPATPGTCAWPPSLPSVPTSRATRVTSEAKRFSWSTMVFSVSFSCRISPRTSTVILRDKIAIGDGGGHLGDVAHLGGQVAGHRIHRVGQILPGAGHPGTCAWPPSRPSVPTSRATRVTSPANECSWSTIVLMVSFSCKISPETFTVIFLDKIALRHRRRHLGDVAHLAGQVQAMEFTESVRSFHVPATPFNCAWPPSLPSVPTSRATRVTSEANAFS